MKVLITNIWLVDRGGTEVYTRDLAIALYKRGVGVEVYSPELGAVAEEIRQAGIHITDSISALRNSPDIIHAHHTQPTLEVLRAFPDTPAVYLIHDRVYPGDSPPHHRQIIKYMASDYNTLERLLEEGIPEQHTGVMLNWVDTKKFALRKRWSEKPKKALVFSNYATRDNHLGIIQQACDLAGLELDCIGRGVGNAVDKPENFLGSYDIVFAKAKAAIEALATGAMVIPCDFRGLGETVVSANFAHLRKYNFGMKILNRPITTELLIEEIHKYEPKDIKRVADLIRKHSAFRPYVDQLLTLYKKTIRQYRYGKRIYDRDGRIAPELRLSKSIRWLRRI